MNAPTLPRLDLLSVVSRAVPRYTSYPTAPHFSEAVGAKTYASWLDTVRTVGEPISLYLHIPFCRSICTYCGCTTKATRKDGPLRDYAETLHAEIALVAEHMGPAEVSHLHWGGGTPNILPADCLERLVDDLKTRFRFRSDMEHAIELDPRHVTREGAELLARIGVNRASLGIQTLNLKVQLAIGRIQPLQVVRGSFAALRNAGITQINADLMYGLPFQSEADVVVTAKEIAQLAPSRIALFGYAHVPWMKSHQRLIADDSLPGTAERLSQAKAARAALRDEGYAEIGIDHFALPSDPLAVAAAEGTLKRNFQGYTDDHATSLIGLGASSISRTPFGYAQNAADTRSWSRAIAEKHVPIVRGKALEGDDQLRTAVITSLLCNFSVDLDQLACEHGSDPTTFDDDLASLEMFVRAGWLTITGRRVEITQHKIELARVIAAQFDRYLTQAGRHSFAV